MFDKYGSKDFDESLMDNVSVFFVWYERLRMIANSVYKWENLPESCNERFIEEQLYLMGKVGFFDHKDYGLVNSKINTHGGLNQYDEAVKYNLNSIEWNITLPAEKCVLVRNNGNCVPTHLFVKHFAERLAKIQMAIDTNLDLQKFSTMIMCDDKERLTFKNLVAQYKGGQPFIYGSKYLDLSKIEPLDINAPFICDKLQPQLNETYNEALRFLGVRSYTQDKKERVQSAEISTMNEVTDMSVAQGLMYRQAAAAEVNKKFGTNISVHLREKDMRSETNPDTNTSANSGYSRVDSGLGDAATTGRTNV